MRRFRCIPESAQTVKGTSWPVRPERRGGSMKRRTFLKGAAVAGAAAGIGCDVSRARAGMRQFKIAQTPQARSTCPYCAVACGGLVHAPGDKARNGRPSAVHVGAEPGG